MRYMVPFILLACVDGKFNPEEALQNLNEETRDADQDGFSIEEGDCNDEDPQIHPQAEEFCDGRDNDCDAQIDEEALKWSWSEGRVQWSAGENVAEVVVRIDDEHWDGESDVADGILDEQQTFSFDEEGRMVGQSIDFGADGSAELEVLYRYNDEGWLIEKMWDVGMDGQAERSVQYGYNPQGQQLYAMWDVEGDGIVDEEIRMQYLDGNRVEEAEYQDGVLVSSTAWEYREGVLLRKETWDGADRVEYRYTSTEDGSRRVEVDEGMDGNIDATFTEYYDEEGRLYKEGRDFNLDQEADILSMWRFDFYGVSDVVRTDSLSENTEEIVIIHQDDGSFLHQHSIDGYFMTSFAEERVAFSCASYSSTVSSSSTATTSSSSTGE